VIPKVPYLLDGKETTITIMGTANFKRKAKSSRGGKMLELSLVQDTDLEAQTAGLTMKERWTLSDAGEALKVQRTAAAVGGADAITLFLRKAQGKPPTPQP
jgi:hypothetical protein